MLIYSITWEYEAITTSSCKFSCKKYDKVSFRHPEVMKISIFMRIIFSRKAPMISLMSVCLPVSPHASARLPLDEFPRNLILETAMKSAYDFSHVSLSASFPACISSSPTERISTKFDIGNCYENPSGKKSKFCFDQTKKKSGSLHEDLSKVYSCWRYTRSPLKHCLQMK